MNSINEFPCEFRYAIEEREKYMKGKILTRGFASDAGEDGVEFLFLERAAREESLNEGVVSPAQRWHCGRP